MIQRSDAWRRWFGLLFLLLGLGMLVWGQTVLEGRLHGVGYILYWLGCATLTVLALGISLLDFWIVRRRARQAHGDLIRDAVGRIQPGHRRPGRRQRHRRRNGPG